MAQAEEFLSLPVKDLNGAGLASSDSWQAALCLLAWGSVGPGGHSGIAAQLLLATVKLILQLGSTQN